MDSYEYIVAYWPTALNQDDVLAAQAVGPVQLSFETAEEAANHAIDSNWWPFIVERIRRG